MDKGNSNEDIFTVNEASSESPNTFTNTNPSEQNEAAKESFPSQTPVTAAPPKTEPLASLPTNPPPAPASPTDRASNEFITTLNGSSDSKKSNFGKFIVIGIILIALIYGGVFFLYTRNQKIKDGVNNVVNNQIFNNSGPTETQLETPAPQFSPEFIKVVNGNITYESGSESRVLINKSDYVGTGIIGFAKVAVSPDNTKMCFEALPPAPEPAIYVANVDGTNTKEIAKNKMKCVFNKESKKVIYENFETETKDIFLFDLEAGSEVNLTPDTADTDFLKSFSLAGVSADGSKAVCIYNEVGGNRSGQCEIDLNTTEIIYN